MIPAWSSRTHRVYFAAPLAQHDIDELGSILAKLTQANKDQLT